MKKHYFHAILLLLILGLTTEVYSFEKKLFKVIDLSPAVLSKGYDFYSTEFYTSNKKKIGLMYAFKLHEIVHDAVASIPANQRNKVLIIARGKGGQSLVTSLYDYDSETSPIPPMLIYKQVAGKIGDTIKVSDIEDKRAIVDLAQVQEEFQIAVVSRTYLQMPSITHEEKLLFFTNGALIFPIDKTSVRWMADATKLEIYLLE